MVKRLPDSSLRDLDYNIGYFELGWNQYACIQYRFRPVKLMHIPNTVFDVENIKSLCKSNDTFFNFEVRKQFCQNKNNLF